MTANRVYVSSRMDKSTFTLPNRFTDATVACRTCAMCRRKASLLSCMLLFLSSPWRPDDRLLIEQKAMRMAVPTAWLALFSVLCVILHCLHRRRVSVAVVMAAPVLSHVLMPLIGVGTVGPPGSLGRKKDFFQSCS